MQLREQLNKTDYEKIAALYVSAFPKEERLPFAVLKKKAENKKGSFLIIEEGSQFIGFMHISEGPSLVYLAFFAIDEACREKHYGSTALQMLKERYPKKTVLIARESLDPTAENYGQRVRRYGFYLRNGFQDIPYTIHECGIAYDAMSTSADTVPEQYLEAIHAWADPMTFKTIGFAMKKRNAD
jgi:ribosomal protein S18 acetylase RimI-like enzyme